MTPEKAKHLNAQTECSALKTDQHSKKFRTNKAPENTTSSPSNAMIVLLPIYRFQGVATITSQLKAPPSLAEIFEIRSLSASTARRISASQANSSGE